MRETITKTPSSRSTLSSGSVGTATTTGSSSSRREKLKERIERNRQQAKVADRRRELSRIAQSIYVEWSNELDEDRLFSSHMAYMEDDGLIKSFLERTFATMIVDGSSSSPVDSAVAAAAAGHAGKVNNTSAGKRKTVHKKKTLRKVELNEHALQMAHSASIQFYQCNDDDSDDEETYSLDALLYALDRYCEYVVNQSLVEKIFCKYNRAGDGKLTRSELLCALQDRERKANRAVKSVTTLLLISPQDMEVVMEEATAYRPTTKGRTRKTRRNGRSNSITRSELLPAMEIWEELAQKKLLQKQMSTCGVSIGCHPSAGGCIIL